MTDNDLEEKERIAQKLGWESYEAAPKPVQNNIDANVNGSTIADPFAMLRSGADQ